jgi:hypothetical protein
MPFKRIAALAGLRPRAEHFQAEYSPQSQILRQPDASLAERRAYSHTSGIGPPGSFVASE